MLIFGNSTALRALEPSDAETFHILAQESSAAKSTTPYWRPYALVDFQKYIESSSNPTGERLSLGICIGKGQSGELIGSLDLHKINWRHGYAEVGIIIWPNSLRGKGLGTDALYCGVNWAFNTLRLRRLHAKVFATNIPSLKCFEKVGFRREGLWREHFFIEGVVVDAVLLGLLRSEFVE